MYSAFEIRNFRCLRRLKLDNLARVNLIAGGNNTGKTALLEALFLHCARVNPATILTIGGMRGLHRAKLEIGRRFIISPGGTLFHNFDDTSAIELVGREGRRHSESVRIAITRDPSKLERIPRALSETGGDGKGTTESTLSGEALEWESGSGAERYTAMLYWQGNQQRMQPAVTPASPFPTYYMGARWLPRFKDEAELFGQLQVRREQEHVVRFLRIVEPRLRALTTILYAGEPMLHADVGSGVLQPLAVVGDGVLRLTRLILHLLHVPKGVLLVDEIENGLHHSAMAGVWKALGAAAASVGAQVFATTHSRECIEAAHQALADERSFRLIRLERIEGDIRAVPYDREALGAAIEAGFEVR